MASRHDGVSNADDLRRAVDLFAARGDRQGQAIALRTLANNMLRHDQHNAALTTFRQALELNHRSLLVNLPMTLHSHCMTLQLAASLCDAFKKRRQMAQLAEHAQDFTGEERAEYLRLGFNPAPYALKTGGKARTAMQVLLAELRRCREICDTNQITLRLVLLPSFPKVFYDSQRGREWTMQIGAYDYLKPEREMFEFAKSNSIPVLALGDYIQREKLDVEEIRSLFLSDGVGHFSEKGHRFCAQAIYETFYRKSSP